jgi:hypothetical protein
MSSIQANPSENRGSRAFRPGSHWAFVAAAIAALIAAAALVMALKPGGATPHYPAQDLTYGSLPKWLPKKAITPAAPKLEVATAAKPILGEEQGFTVHAQVPTGSADVTAVGPQVPSYVANYAQSGLWPSSKLVPSTFYVTFADVTGSIPIAARAFNVLTDGGQLVPATISVKGGGKVPAVVRAGQTLKLLVKSETVEGQGGFRWAPEGPKILVGWIYQLELD